MPLSVRRRFQVFQRDSFTCQYCGRTSPDVVLEVDHIVPLSKGGSDDVMNLWTSCWDCNRGKAAKSLDVVVTGEDPYDRAVMLLERERQINEYNTVLAAINKRVEDDLASLEEYWPRHLRPADRTGLRRLLEHLPCETIYQAMEIAVNNKATHGLGYVYAVIYNRSGRDNQSSRGGSACHG